MQMSDEMRFIEQARELLNSIEISMEHLQAEKEKHFPALTDAQFAKMLGVTPATFSDYKNSKQARPSLLVAIKAAFILGMDLRTLVPQAPQIDHFFSKNLR